MRRLPRVSMARIPTQARAVDMVHAILDAGIRVLQDEGTAKFTTNRVAQVAGISPGSLYQYFGNKEAIVAGIVERGVIDSEAALQGLIGGDALHRPAAETVEMMLRVLTLQLEAYRPLLREILLITPMSPETGLMRVLDTRVSGLIRDWVTVQTGRVALPDPAATVYVATSTLTYGFLRWITDPWETFDTDRFVAAMTQMVCAQLEGDATAG